MEKLEKFVEKYFRFTRCTCAFPFTLHWEPGFRVQLSLAKKRTLHYYIWLCLYIFIVGIFTIIVNYYLVKLSPVYLEQHNYTNVALHSLFAMYPIFAAAMQIPFYSHTQDTMQLANGIVGLVKNLESQHFGKGAFKKSQKIRTIIIAGLCGNTIYGALPVIIPLFILYRKEYWFLGSYFYRFVLHILSENYEWLATICSLSMDLWFSYYLCGAFYLSLHISLNLMHTFKVSTVQLITRGKRDNMKLEEQLIVCSKLRILITLYNQVFGTLHIPLLKTTMGIWMVLCIVIAVRLSGKTGIFITVLGVFGSIVVGILIIVFITFNAMVSEYSVKFQKYLGRKKIGRAVERRMIRAYRVDEVKSGGFYGIRKITCLTVLAMISNMSGSALISFHV